MSARQNILAGRCLYAVKYPTVKCSDLKCPKANNLKSSSTNAVMYVRSDVSVVVVNEQ